MLKSVLGLTEVAVVAVPEAGGVALVVIAYSYPTTPPTADQLISAPVDVILLTEGVDGDVQVGVCVLNGLVDQAE